MNDATKEFGTETAIGNLPRTPIFLDSVWVDTWPTAGDKPPQDLYMGGNSFGMQRITIARHGSYSGRDAPRNVPAEAKLPGSILIEFADGHAEPTKLETLWTFNWHRNYQPPATRPR